MSEKPCKEVVGTYRALMEKRGKGENTGAAESAGPCVSAFARSGLRYLALTPTPSKGVNCHKAKTRFPRDKEDRRRLRTVKPR